MASEMPATGSVPPRPGRRQVSAAVYRRPPGVGWLISFLVLVPLLLGAISYGLHERSRPTAEGATGKIPSLAPLTPPNAPAPANTPPNAPNAPAPANTPPNVPNVPGPANAPPNVPNVPGPANAPPNVPNVPGPANAPPNVPNVPGPVNTPPNVPGPVNTPPNVPGPANTQPNVPGPVNTPPNGPGPVNTPPNGPGPANTQPNVPGPANTPPNVPGPANTPSNAPGPPAGGTVDCAHLQDAIRSVLVTPITFDTNESALTTATEQQLTLVADKLKACPRTNVAINGYTDNTGSDWINIPLSERRANAVADFLTGKGVSRDHLTAKGLGSADPVASNATPEGRTQNRRVEIVVG